jgi:hypothetical protein
MWTQSTRPGIAVQSPTTADCRHVRAPFDQGFHVVSRRADLSSDAKVLHAFLVSLHRTGRELTQREMAAELGLTRHRVWTALQSLVTADLVRTIRYGLGRPNGYELLGLDVADLEGTSGPETAVRPVRRARPASPDSSRAGTYYPNKRRKNDGYTYPPRSSSSLMETRQGRYVRPGG